MEDKRQETMDRGTETNYVGHETQDCGQKSEPGGRETKNK